MITTQDTTQDTTLALTDLFVLVAKINEHPDVSDDLRSMIWNEVDRILNPELQRVVAHTRLDQIKASIGDKIAARIKEQQ